MSAGSGATCVVSYKAQGIYCCVVDHILSVILSAKCALMLLCVRQIRELDSHKKIQTLLSLSGLTDNEVSYFIKEPPAKAIVKQRLPRKLQNQDVSASSTVDKPTRNGLSVTFSAMYTTFCVHC